MTARSRTTWRLEEQAKKGNHRTVAFVASKLCRCGSTVLVCFGLGHGRFGDSFESQIRVMMTLRCYSQPEWPNLASPCVPLLCLRQLEHCRFGSPTHPPPSGPIGTRMLSGAVHSEFPIILPVLGSHCQGTGGCANISQLSNVTLPQAINATQTCTPIISQTEYTNQLVARAKLLLDSPARHASSCSRAHATRLSINVLQW